jgi:hypothetical protein
MNTCIKMRSAALGLALVGTIFVLAGHVLYPALKSVSTYRRSDGMFVSIHPDPSPWIIPLGWSLGFMLLLAALVLFVVSRRHSNDDRAA